MLLNQWCYLLGFLAFVIGLFFLCTPGPFARALNALPRHKLSAYILSTLAWLWGGYALLQMKMDFLVPYEKLIPLGILICIPLTWVWLDNLLVCRAMGAILLLFPYELLHVARCHPSPWRLVLVSFAYICIIQGMIIMLYPWKMRQWIAWFTATPLRSRLCGILYLITGTSLIALGISVLNK